jgi:type IV pilus assembly protein PilM
MIRELFLPDKINNYYLFSKRIIGLDIGKTHISATLVVAKGKQTTIEKYVEEKIELGVTTNYVERATKTLQLVMAQFDSYDEIRVALSSSIAIFKEIKLPFLSHEKIKMVVNYEIEPLLPFSLNDAVVDFIVTKQFPQEASSQVLVAAVQNQHIAAALEICAGAGISPDVLTIDLFALYSLYKNIPTYTSLQGNIVLIDLGIQATRIAYIQQGQLRFIRTLGKGTYHIAKEVSEALAMQPNETMEYIIRYGLEKSTNQQYLQAITQSLTSFWQEIQFTLQSFLIQGTAQEKISQIVLLGGGSEIKKIAEFASSQLNIPCELMHITDVLQNHSITVKNKIALPSSSIISLATAIPSEVTEQFNLRQGEFTSAKEGILDKQMLVAAGLCLLLLGTLGTHIFLQIRAFRNSAIASQNEAVQALKERSNFAAPLQDGLRNIKKEKEILNTAISIAQDEVKKQEETWFAFAGPARATMLKYLLELSKRIDKDSLGFDIQSLQIGNGVMTLKASVKNHEALRILEKELKESKLFTYVSSPEETTFTMKITLAKNGEE